MWKKAILGALTTLALLALGVAIAATTAGPGLIAKTPLDKELRWEPCPTAVMPEGCRLAVLRGDPRKRNADVFVELPAGAKIPSHTHTSSERMVVMSGELSVLYDGQQPVTLKPGMYAYGPAKTPHETTCISSGPCVIFVAFETPIDAWRYTKGAQ